MGLLPNQRLPNGMHPAVPEDSGQFWQDATSSAGQKGMCIMCTENLTARFSFQKSYLLPLSDTLLLKEFLTPFA